MSDFIKIHDLISLEGKTSIITGGSGHLGTAISESLAELGSDIIIIGRNEDKGSDVASKISKEFKINCKFEIVDINSKESIESFFTQINQVDILVNNAFTWPNILQFEETKWEDFENTLKSGITSPFFITKKATELMKKRDAGNIINMGSMYGMVSPNFKIYKEQPKMGNAIAYNASKAAMIQMTKYLAVHLAKWNIRVNCISPGPFPRPGTFSNDKKWFEKELCDMNPLHRLGEPWQIKGTVMLLATKLGDYITGQNISIDGGWTSW